MIKCMDNPLSVARAVSVLERRVHQAGMRVTMKTDFREYAEVRKSVRPDSDVSAMFDHRCTEDLSDGRGFWLHCHNPEGETVALQAARVDWIETSLAQWCMPWMSTLYRMRGDKVEPETYRPLPNSTAERIKGWVAYHGEFWVQPEHRGRVAGNLLEALPRLGLMMIYMRWNPDHVWGVITDILAARGAGIRMGFTTQQPSLLNWEIEPEGAGRSETMVCCDNRDLAFLADFETGPTNEWAKRRFGYSNNGGTGEAAQAGDVAAVHEQVTEIRKAPVAAQKVEQLKQAE